MSGKFIYGELAASLRVGDKVRFCNSPTPGKAGKILVPRSKAEENAILRKIKGSVGWVEVLPQLGAKVTSHAIAESGAASAVNLSVPVSVRGRLKIT